MVGAHAPGSGTPTGTVTVSDGKRSCIADLTGGIGSCRITEPATGHYELTATYGGDGNFDASGVSRQSDRLTRHQFTRSPAFLGHVAARVVQIYQQ